MDINYTVFLEVRSNNEGSEIRFNALKRSTQIREMYTILKAITTLVPMKKKLNTESLH